MAARHTTPRIAIIGSGFSGLCLGIQLKHAGIDSFTIFEKYDRLGGTWRDNVYPGAACDVPSFLYSFSFEPKLDWSRKWSPQPEILAYMDHCAEKYGILPHVRFSTAVERARFDQDAGVWRIHTSTGEEVEAEVLISAVGQLHRPYTPKIPGLEDFAGAVFHSARWNREVDLHDKRVAVIGNAASAIQFIPEIAPIVRQLQIFQRSPNWMIERGDRAYTEREKVRFARYPSLARLYRWFLWLRFELFFFPAIRRNRLVSRRLTRLALQNLEDHIPDPAARERLVPDYPITAKRLLVSDNYYSTLTRPNVTLVTGGIERCTTDGVVTKEGATIPADVIILATGFETTAFLAPMRIEGLGARTLEESWRGGAEAYLGITVAGFPNFFMTYGPNTNLGHNSIIFMIECQTRYIIECIQALGERNLKYLDLRPEVMRAYNRRVQQELQRTTWAQTGKTWYKNTEGKITNNWYGTTFHYWWRTRQVDFDLYEQVGTRAAARARVNGAARAVPPAESAISRRSEPSVAAPPGGRSSGP